MPHIRTADAASPLAVDWDESRLEAAPWVPAFDRAVFEADARSTGSDVVDPARRSPPARLPPRTAGLVTANSDDCLRFNFRRS